MKKYIKRFVATLITLSLIAGVITGGVVGFFLWMQLGDWLIPVDISYRLARQIAYVIVSLIVAFSLLLALDDELFDDD